MTTPNIKTKVVIISDTHGTRPLGPFSGEDDPTTEDEFEDLDEDDVNRVITGYREPLAQCDVVIHCGDLTGNSTESEYATTFEMLRAIRAPLKLVIAGNHDTTLDETCWHPKRTTYLQEQKRKIEKIIADAELDGVKYLTEGTHSFALSNGAHLKVYASPWTPRYGHGWGFQYDTMSTSSAQDPPHKFDIPKDIDFAITHGPPKGILDIASSDANGAGCPWTFDAIRKAKPRVHCFGHIHEAWGATLAKWKIGSGNVLGTVQDHIDEASSKPVWKAVLGGPRGRTVHYIGRNGQSVPMEDVLKASKKRGFTIDLTQGEHASTPGQGTLFVNAAIMNRRYTPTQLPWIVEIDLPPVEESLKAGE